MNLNASTAMETPHILIVPSPGMGHLIPLVQLAKLLVSRHAFSVTFIVPNIGEPPKAQKSFLQNLPQDIGHVLLPPVNLDDLPPDAGPEVKICVAMIRSIPSTRNVFSLLVGQKRVVALLTDLFGCDIFDVADELEVPSYVYFSPSTFCLMLFLHLPELDKKITCEYRDWPDPIMLPGCVPVYGKDLVQPIQDRRDEAYKWILHICQSLRSMPKGILLNSFMELEPGAIQVLQKEEAGRPPFYLIGPVVQSGSDDETDGSGCLDWLDGQPFGSVLFVSFGSGGTLSYEQLNELAHGLEMSEQRFIWVVRSPDENSSSGTFFSAQSQDDPFGFLPEGYPERIKGRGLLVPSWAPQIKILGHESTGGFLTHCGWNSINESLINGLPLIAWPLYAEQKMNAVMLIEETKVALRPKFDENGLVKREEIAKVVKELIEGEDGKRVRDRMQELSYAAKKAYNEDGDSTKALAKLALELKKQKVG
ncbi:hypothetical protein Ancab_037974 [Ancistrocladus abbreviatus]